MRKWICVMCSILLLSFMATACNSAYKSAGGAVPDTAQPSSNADTPDTNAGYPDRMKKLDEELLEKVDRASLTTDKLQLLFKALADDSYENRTMSDSNKILAYTMDLLYDFLGTKESGDIESEELEKLFYGVSVISLEEGRIICFSGKPLIFGESSDSKYAFYQRERNGAVSAYKLYLQDHKRIGDVFIKNINENSSLLFIDGYTGMNFNNPQFIDAFRIDSNQCRYVRALEQYRYKDGDFISQEGSIPYEVKIKKFTGDEIVFVSGDDESNTLKAYFDNKKLTFSIRADK